MGLPDLFLDFLDLRAVSERAALGKSESGIYMVHKDSRSLEEVAGVSRARHCC